MNHNVMALLKWHMFISLVKMCFQVPAVALTHMAIKHITGLASAIFNILKKFQDCHTLANQRTQYFAEISSNIGANLIAYGF